MRGGYGLTFLDSSTDRGTSTGFTRTTTYVASLDANRTPANRLSNPFPTGILQPAGPALGPGDGARHRTSRYHIRDRKIPEFHTWSIGMQHELPWRSVARRLLHRQRHAQDRRQPADQRPDAASRSRSATRSSTRSCRTRSSA